MDIWYSTISATEDLLDAPSESRQVSLKGAEAERSQGRSEERHEAAAKAHHARQPAGGSKQAQLRRRAIPDRQPAAGGRPVCATCRITYGLPRVDQLEGMVHEQFRAYRETLQDDQHQLLERFEWVDMARKVVGVGSVGTRAFIGLLQGHDQQDPLFLQVKEAPRFGAGGSSSEESIYAQPGRARGAGTSGGCRRRATSSWAGRRAHEAGRFLYWRQLRDMKGSAVPRGDGAADPSRSTHGVCGGTLARAHARSGDPVAIAAYLGSGGQLRPSRSTDFSRALRGSERS